MSKTTRKEKEQGYSIRENIYQLEKNAIFRDALSHMGETMVYWTASEAQYQFNNAFGRRAEALVTGKRSKCVSAMHQFPPLHSIFISKINATVLININANFSMQTD